MGVQPNAELNQWSVIKWSVIRWAETNTRQDYISNQENGDPTHK
jgi:hypothetical protein